MKWSWSRTTGYEVSSKGDSRFSAFYAIMPDGRSLEMHYQCDVKGYQPGGRDWKLGKGKPPLDKNVDTWEAYLGLWVLWAKDNLPLMRELWFKTVENPVLRDRFASTAINQAHALCEILNHPEWLKEGN